MTKNISNILTEQEQQYLWDNININCNFRDKINLNNKYLHCQLMTSIFRPQLYRIYSLLANYLGINTVIYDYIEKNSKYILFSESMIKEDEKLYEDELYPDNPINESIFLLWTNIIEQLANLNNNHIKEEFYKQIFYSLLIFDLDKEIAIIGKNDDYKLSPYYDYGGVYFNQESLELENDIYYLPQNKLSDDLLIGENPSNIEVIINKEFQNLIETIILSNNQDNIEEYDIKLKMCLDNLDNDFIENCLNINILKIIENDNKHNYSDNMKKLIEIMFQHSKKILIEQINNIKKNKKK